jgi:predicted HicB family RNase H-like nuclease
MSKQDELDGCTVNVYLDEDGEYLAHFLERPEISAFADSPEDALRELKITWDGVKESYRAHDEAIPIAPARKDYSGQFNVRIDKRVHRSLAIEAAQNGVSLNALVAQKLASSIVKQPQQ